MISKVDAPMRRMRPSAAGSRPNRRVQYDSLITATGCAPATALSAAVNNRPAAGLNPNCVKRSPETYCTVAFSMS